MKKIFIFLILVCFSSVHAQFETATKNINKYYNKRLPTRNTNYTTYQDMDGSAWSTYVDSDTWVESPYLDVDGYAYMLLFTRSSGTTGITDFKVEARVLYNNTGLGYFDPKMYDHNGEAITVIFSTYHAAEGPITVDLRGCYQIRFKYKTTTEQDVSHHYKFHVFLSNYEDDQSRWISNLTTTVDSLKEQLLTEVLSKRNTSNLYDSEDREQGTYLDSLGAFKTAATYCWSGYIPVSASTEYTRNKVKTDGNSVYQRIWCFDASYNLLGQTGSNLDYTFTTLASTAYIGVNVYLGVAYTYDAREDFNVTEGDQVSNTLSYSIAIDQLNYLEQLDFLRDELTNEILRVRNTSNLYDWDEQVDGIYLKTDGSFGTSSTYSWSGFIPVNAETEYTRNYVKLDGNTLYQAIWCFDEDYTLLGQAGSNLDYTFTTLASTEYIGFNVYLGPTYDFDIRKTLNVCLGDQKSYTKSYSVLVDLISDLANGLIPTSRNDVLVADNEGIKIYSTYNGYTPIAMLNDYIFAKSGSSYYILNGWDGVATAVDYDSINPGQTRGFAAFVKASSTVTRLIIGYYDGKVFHNYYDGGGINDWGETTLWGLPNIVNMDSSTTTSYAGQTRYKYRFPSSTLYAHRIMGGTGYLPHIMYYVGSTRTIEYDVFFWGIYPTLANSPSAVFFTSDGVNAYCQYEYGIHKTNTSTTQAVDWTGVLDAIPGDLQVQSRAPVTPASGAKEPTNVFTFGTAKNVTAIADTLTGTRTVVRSTGHGLSSGNIVRFTSVSLTENDENWLAPDSAINIINNSAVAAWVGTTPPGGNGKFFKVTKVDDNNFYISEAVGNPHNHFYCKHIHSVDPCLHGVVISTGEEGNESNLTFLETKSFNGWDNKPLGEFSQIHITADPTNAIQRPIGIWMNDSIIVFASDEINLTRKVSFAADRSDTVGIPGSGIMRGSLQYVDAYKSLDHPLICDEPAYFFKKIGNVMFYCGEYGSLFASWDDGVTWKFIVKLPWNIRVMCGYNNDQTEFIASYSSSVYYLIKIEN
jgi:hypothetical protein